WHTLLLLLVLAAYAGRSFYLRGFAPSAVHGRLARYALVIFTEWFFVALVWLGTRTRGVTLRELVGGSWARWTAALRDVGIAVGFLVVSNVVLGLFTHLIHAKQQANIGQMLPQGPVEIAVWVLLSLSAGICEEIVFRGYLQKQLSAMVKSAPAGLVLQGVLFGAAHSYQGAQYALVIALLGTMLGLLAQWRKSLRPGIVSHFLQDGVLALIGRQ
ncbi:MAG: type II CAAX prenyl endopeptidase Rce1 family protein, partial [Terriglobales bacterium]